MDTEHSGHRYYTTMGSDLERDGMFLELVVDGRSEAPVLEVFFSDATGTFALNTLETASVPLEIVQGLVREAHERLPPLREDAKGDAAPTI